MTLSYEHYFREEAVESSISVEREDLYHPLLVENKMGHWLVGNLEVALALSYGKASEETMDYALVEMDRHVDCLQAAQVVGSCLIVKAALVLAGVDLTVKLHYT